MNPSCTLTPDQFQLVFPFHIGVDTELQICSLGRSLLKVDPSIQLGDSFDESFRIARPACTIGSFEQLADLKSSLIMLEPRRGTLCLRGQVLVNANRALIVGSPWIRSFDDIHRSGLTLRDFAFHDTTADLLFLVQAKGVALRETQQLSRRLQCQSKELMAAIQEAEFANRAKSVFLTNVSHELRTPMTAILGYADMIFDQLESTRQKEFLDIIRHQGKRLLAMMDDVLDLSHIESSGFKIQRKPIQVFEFLHDLERVFCSRFQSKGIRFQVQCHSHVPAEIHTNRTRLKQILKNLLDNAWTYTDEGQVDLVVEFVQGPAGGMLRMQVIDTGIGINPDDVERLFRPFTQADESHSRQHGGTGIGLAISRRLAQMLGGELSATSQPGQGSTFTLTIAADRPAQTVLASPTYGKPTRKRRVGSASYPYPELNCRILLVEDTPLNQAMIRRLLELASAEVVLAKHGLQAVELLVSDEESRFDLVLMDVQMPVLDGIEATRRIRQAGLDLPIIALTANALNRDREACLSAGCDDFLTKPVDRDRLFQAIRTQLERARPACDGVLETLAEEPV